MALAAHVIIVFLKPFQAHLVKGKRLDCIETFNLVSGRRILRTRTSCRRRDYQFGFARSLDRKNVTLRASFDEGRTWPVLRTLESGISGYSDLAVGPDGTIYCFYERGGVNDVMWDTKHLCVARFSLHWLIDRKP